LIPSILRKRAFGLFGLFKIVEKFPQFVVSASTEDESSNRKDNTNDGSPDGTIGGLFGAGFALTGSAFALATSTSFLGDYFREKQNNDEKNYKESDSDRDR
jgi:hypothetical protein